MKEENIWKSDRRIRWSAIVKYRTDNGFLEVEHLLSELEDLHDLVEQGPHWDTIKDIKIIRINSLEGPLTIEEAKEI